MDGARCHRWSRFPKTFDRLTHTLLLPCICALSQPLAMSIWLSASVRRLRGMNSNVSRFSHYAFIIALKVTSRYHVFSRRLSLPASLLVSIAGLMKLACFMGPWGVSVPAGLMVKSLIPLRAASNSTRPTNINQLDQWCHCKTGAMHSWSALIRFFITWVKKWIAKPKLGFLTWGLNEQQFWPRQRTQSCPKTAFRFYSQSFKILS